MKSTYELADLLGVTHQTILNWVRNAWLSPALIDERGMARFSDDQCERLKAALPLPKYNERKEWLKQFSVETEIAPRNNYLEPANTRYIVPESGSASNPTDLEKKQRISETVAKTNKLLMTALSRRTNIHDVAELTQHTAEYFEFCQLEAFVPSFRSLCNWYGYSERQMTELLKSDTAAGKSFELLRDMIRTNYEQSGLKNEVNSIFAMFLLKSQEGYVETQKTIVEHQSVLGTPKTAEEIADYIDADIVELD